MLKSDIGCSHSNKPPPSLFLVHHCRIITRSLCVACHSPVVKKLLNSLFERESLSETQLEDVYGWLFNIQVVNQKEINRSSWESMLTNDAYGSNRNRHRSHHFYNSVRCQDDCHIQCSHQSRKKSYSQSSLDMNTAGLNQIEDEIDSDSYELVVTVAEVHQYSWMLNDFEYLLESSKMHKSEQESSKDKKFCTKCRNIKVRRMERKFHPYKKKLQNN
ncbi:uncharacterized protein LOC142322900 [Lycorma delicatula]|uniref:uncharacterized protein LOC142322900 n=1 Tax=Lycorma delicatula TaxID=130591 RepID=UPI003F516DB3